jgi:hypothetical protein
MALAVKSKPVDDAFVRRQAEDARPRIARLRPRRDGTHLGEAASHPQHRIDDLAVLVEAGSDADRIGEIEAEGVDCESGVVRSRGIRGQDLQCFDGERMRVLGIDPMQQRSRQAVEESNHRGNPEKN